MTTKNQRLIVLEHLRKRPMTAMYGFDSLRIINLSARIAELRQMGYEIESDWREAPGLYGKPMRFVSYRLVKEPK